MSEHNEQAGRPAPETQPQPLPAIATETLNGLRTWRVGEQPPYPGTIDFLSSATKQWDYELSTRPAAAPEIDTRNFVRGGMLQRHTWGAWGAGKHPETVGLLVMPNGSIGQAHSPTAPRYLGNGYSHPYDAQGYRAHLEDRIVDRTGQPVQPATDPELPREYWEYYMSPERSTTDIASLYTRALEQWDRDRTPEARTTLRGVAQALNDRVAAERNTMSAAHHALQRARLERQQLENGLKFYKTVDQDDPDLPPEVKRAAEQALAQARKIDEQVKQANTNYGTLIQTRIEASKAMYWAAMAGLEAEASNTDGRKFRMTADPQGGPLRMRTQHALNTDDGSIELNYARVHGHAGRWTIYRDGQATFHVRQGNRPVKFFFDAAGNPTQTDPAESQTGRRPQPEKVSRRGKAAKKNADTRDKEQPRPAPPK